MKWSSSLLFMVIDDPPPPHNPPQMPPQDVLAFVGIFTDAHLIINAKRSVERITQTLVSKFQELAAHTPPPTNTQRLGVAAAVGLATLISGFVGSYRHINGDGVRMAGSATVVVMMRMMMMMMMIMMMIMMVSVLMLKVTGACRVVWCRRTRWGC
jgi:hypothetical protein